MDKINDTMTNDKDSDGELKNTKGLDNEMLLQQ